MMCVKEFMKVTQQRQHKFFYILLQELPNFEIIYPKNKLRCFEIIWLRASKCPQNQNFKKSSQPTAYIPWNGEGKASWVHERDG